MIIRLLVLLVLGLPIILGQAPAVVAQTEMSAILESLREAEKAVTSANGTTSVVVENYGPVLPGVPEGSLLHTRTEYRWEFQSPEWRHEEKSEIGQSGVEGNTAITGYRDGKYILYVPASNRMMVYGPAGKNKVKPLWAQYLGLRHLVDDAPSLVQQLETASSRVAGSDTLNGVATAVVMGTTPQRQEVKWWLAPTYGYRPVRCETRWVPDDTAFTQVTVVEEYGQFTEVAEGIWLPKHKCVKKTGTRSDGTSATLIEITADSSFGSINVPKDPSSLSIVPAAGTEVLYRE